MLDQITNIFTIVNLTLYAYVSYLSLKRWRFSAANRRFAIVVVLSFFWILSNFLQIFDSPIYMFVFRVNFFLAALIAGAMVSFSFHYPKEDYKFTLIKEIAICLPVILIAILSFTDIFFTPTGFRTQQTMPLYYVYFGLLFIYFIFIGGVKLIIKLKSSSGIQKIQLSYLLSGYLIAILVLLIESLYFNLVGDIGIVLDKMIFNISILFTAASVYISMRYRFLDIKIVIRKGFIKLVSLLLLFGSYFFLVLWAQHNIPLRGTNQQIVFLSLVTIIIVITIDPIKKLIAKIVDGLFNSNEKKQENIRRQIDAAAKGRDTFDGLIRSIKQIYTEVANVSEAYFLEFDDEFFQRSPELKSYLLTKRKIVITDELPYRFEENEQYPKMYEELKRQKFKVLIPICEDAIVIGCFALLGRIGDKTYSTQKVRELYTLKGQFTDALINAKLYRQAIERIKKD